MPSDYEEIRSIYYEMFEKDPQKAKAILVHALYVSGEEYDQLKTEKDKIIADQQVIIERLKSEYCPDYKNCVRRTAAIEGDKNG